MSVVYPDDGVIAVWDAAPFAHIEDYDQWAVELADPSGHVAAGAVAFISVGGDAVEVRLGGDVAGSPVSGPHRLVSSGVVRVSGPHTIGGVLWDNTVELVVPAGRYSVTAYRAGRITLLISH